MPTAPRPYPPPSARSTNATTVAASAAGVAQSGQRTISCGARSTRWGGTAVRSQRRPQHVGQTMPVPAQSTQRASGGAPGAGRRPPQLGQRSRA